MAVLLNRLGTKIKKKREDLRLSQEIFAEQCGFDRTYISLVERGHRNISILNLAKFAQGLGMNLAQLTNGIDDGIDAD